MKFQVYVPEKASREPLPVIYFLSGLTCTDENFVLKSGFQRYASEEEVIVVVSDTSPRDVGEFEGDSYIGYSAGYYLNST